MTQITCVICKYWVRRFKIGQKFYDTSNGECRHNSPKKSPNPYNEQGMIFTEQNYWCGKGKPNE